MSASDPDTLPVSVIIPVHNRADLLPRAIASALAQAPARPDEILVVDDASSDASAEVAASLGATVLVNDTNLGPGPARNVALAAARHDWVAMLDSDDEWLPDHLAVLWALREPFVALGATALSIGLQGRELALGPDASSPVRITSPRQLVFPDNPLPASGVIARRDLMLELGGFKPLGGGEDLDLWIRLAERGQILAHPHLGYRWRIHAAQTSKDKAMMQSHLHRIVQSYADREWCTPDVLRSVDVLLTWDAFRAGDLSRTSAVAKLARPGNIRHLLRLLLRRRRMRARAVALEASDRAR